MSKQHYTAKKVVSAGCILGESPAWHPQTATWWWVDIEGKAVYQWSGREGEEPKKFLFRQRPSKLFGVDAEHWLVATETALVHWNFLTAEKDIIATIPQLPHHRTNDGSVDPHGNVWIGTMHEEAASATGSVYRLGEDGLKCMLHPVSIPNGMLWQGDALHFIDSVTPWMNTYHFDESAVALQFRRTSLIFPDDGGVPDGACLDEDCHAWIAFWGAGVVRCYDLHSAECLAEVIVDAPQVSSCAFGGLDNNQLLITTARQGMSDAELKKYLQSGDVFLIELPVKGAKLSNWKKKW